MTSEVRKQIEAMFRGYGKDIVERITAEDGEEAQRAQGRSENWVIGESANRVIEGQRPAGRVVEIELGEQPRRVRRCGVVRADGTRCGMKVRGRGKVCERHRWWEGSVAWTKYGLEFPDNRAAVQEMLAWTVDGVLERRIRPQAAVAIVQACKVLLRMSV